MGVTYTRKEIRTRVQALTRDSDDSVVSEANKNRLIAEVHRDFVERTKCNRNTVIFSLADGTSDGTLEYDKYSDDRLATHDPTLTYFDYEGFPWYTLSNCDAIISIERFVASDDGTATVLTPVDAEDIDRLNLLSGANKYPYWYQTDAPDTFRMLRELSAAAYTIKIRIVYMESVIDLVSDDESPSDTDNPTMTTGTGLDDMRVGVGSRSAKKWDFKVMVEGTPDTYSYRTDDGDWSTEPYINMTTEAQKQSSADPFSVYWVANTGHTAGNIWTTHQDDPQVGNVPLKFRKAVVWGVAAECFAIRGDERASLYYQKYEREVERCQGEVHIDHYDKPYQIKVRSSGAGG